MNIIQRAYAQWEILNEEFEKEHGDLLRNESEIVAKKDITTKKKVLQDMLTQAKDNDGWLDTIEFGRLLGIYKIQLEKYYDLGFITEEEYKEGSDISIKK